MPPAKKKDSNRAMWESATWKAASELKGNFM